MAAAGWIRAAVKVDDHRKPGIRRQLWRPDVQVQTVLAPMRIRQPPSGKLRGTPVQIGPPDAHWTRDAAPGTVPHADRQPAGPGRERPGLLNCRIEGAAESRNIAPHPQKRDLHRTVNGCLPVQSGMEFTRRSVRVGIRSSMNLRLNPTLCE